MPTCRPAWGTVVPAAIALVVLAGSAPAAATTEERPPPTATPAFVQVAAGGEHTIAVTERGAVHAWGAGDAGQLGTGGTAEQPTPAAIDPMPGLAEGDHVTQVAAGTAHSLAVTAHGAVYAWGAGDAGQLGDGARQQRQRPVEITGFFALDDGDHVTQVAAGTAHSLAVTAHGAVYAWGAGDAGQLGDGTGADRPSPVRLTQFPGLDVGDAIVQVAAAQRADLGGSGGAHSVAVSAAGSVYTWGDGELGQLGTGAERRRFSPTLVEGVADLDGDRVVQVVAGQGHTVALTEQGTVMAWGDGGAGQLGHGTPESSLVPVRVTAAEPFVEVAAGAEHTVAVTADGAVYSWGGGTRGQLGTGATSSHSEPVAAAPVPFPGEDHPVVQVAAGPWHSTAVTAVGGVYAWGAGASGRLGDGQRAEHAEPVGIVVGELSGEVEITGEVNVGDELVAEARGWQLGETFAYQWFLDGQEIDGATFATYLPIPADLGGELTVQVRVAAVNWAPGAALSGPVLVGGQPPVLHTEALPGAVEGEPYEAAVEVDGTPAPTFELDGDLPPGIAFDPASGTLAGTPEAAGTFTLVVRASNELGEDQRQLTLTVAPSTPADADGPPPWWWLVAAGLLVAAAGLVAVLRRRGRPDDDGSGDLA